MINACVAGYLGRDAELKQVGNDYVCSFSVASDEKRGENKTTTWVLCNLWGKRGESLAKHLTKGKPVCVTGSMSTREYDKRDGGRAFSIELRVSDLALLGGGERRENNGTVKPSSRSNDYDDDSYGAVTDDDCPF